MRELVLEFLYVCYRVIMIMVAWMVANVIASFFQSWPLD